MVTSGCLSPATAKRDSHIILPPTSLEYLCDENAFPQTLILASVKGRIQMQKGLMANLILIPSGSDVEGLFLSSKSGVYPSVYPPI